MFVRAYLRASTDQQDASRARAALDAFANGRGLRIATRYIENESGATLQRPELFRLLADSQPGDVLLTEQVDRLARLPADDCIRERRLKERFPGTELSRAGGSPSTRTHGVPENERLSEQNGAITGALPVIQSRRANSWCEGCGL